MTRTSGVGHRATPGRAAARGGAVALVALLSLLPFALLVVWSLAESWRFPVLWPDALGLDAWRGVAGGGATLRALGRSALLAAGVGVLGTAIALPAGRVLARLRGWRRHAAAAAAFLPVAAPPIALATGLQLALLRAGVGGTATGVLVAHLVPAAGYLALFWLGVLDAPDAPFGRAEDDARTLGASPRQTWTRVVLPMLRVPLVESFALGFLVSWSQFALTLVIGGGAVRTLPLEVFAYVGAGQDRLAAAGALLLGVPPVLALAAARLAAGRTQVAPP